MKRTGQQGQIACRALVAAGLALFLVDCSMVDSVEDKTLSAKSALGTESYIDRCTQFAQKAYPDVDIKVTDQHFAIGDSMNQAIVDVAATAAVGADAKTVRQVAAQCRFDNGIIVDFHWTKSPVR